MDTRKNLIIIMPDQLRSDYVGCYGNSNVRTPNIDRLAGEGVQFCNMYCAAPLCGPSRISFATSTYFSEHNHRNYWSEVSPDVPNLVTSLKDAGYKTGMFGKNHLFTYARLNEVWDELDEICLGNYDGHPDYHHSFSSFTLADDHPFNITQRLTTEGLDFIDRYKDGQFFLWLNFQDPHPAFCCPEPYASMFNPDDVDITPVMTDYDRDSQPRRNYTFYKHSEMDKCTPDDLKRAIAHYMGQIAYVDHNVGRVLDKLEELGIRDDTAVLFMSDHGELLGSYGLTHKNPTFYECLSHIPAILSVPDRKYSGVKYTGLTEEVDMTPTILDTLGVEIPPTMVGRSMKGDLECKDYTGKETVLCEAGAGAPTCKEPIEGYIQVAPHAPTSFGPGAMLRWKNLKLSIYGDDTCELYDLENDPDELHNLYKDDRYKEIREKMTLMLLKRILTVKVRDIGQIDWKYDKYSNDVRFEPLEN